MVTFSNWFLLRQVSINIIGDIVKTVNCLVGPDKLKRNFKWLQKMKPHLEISKRERAHVVAIRKQGGNPRVQQPTAFTSHILK